MLVTHTRFESQLLEERNKDRMKFYSFNMMVTMRNQGPAGYGFTLCGFC